MIQAIQVLRFHLLELEKVWYLVYSSAIGREKGEDHIHQGSVQKRIIIICSLYVCVCVLSTLVEKKRFILINGDVWCAYFSFSLKISETSLPFLDRFIRQIRHNVRVCIGQRLIKRQLTRSQVQSHLTFVHSRFMNYAIILLIVISHV